MDPAFIEDAGSIRKMTLYPSLYPGSCLNPWFYGNQNLTV